MRTLLMSRCSTYKCFKMSLKYLFGVKVYVQTFTFVVLGVDGVDGLVWVLVVWV